MKNITNTIPKSYHDVYRLFLSLADEILDACESHALAHEAIKAKVDEVYLPHKGTWIWDFAYERFFEPYDED